jgi:hypothetical protein
MENQNRETTREIQEATGLSEITGYPRKIADAIIPVIDVNPKLKYSNKIHTSFLTGGGGTSAGIYTTPMDKDFYLTGACLSIVKNATSNSTVTSIRVGTADGPTSNIISIIGLTLTEQDQTVWCPFPIPLRLARGSAITLITDSTGAGYEVRGSIIGYLSNDVGY